LKLDSRHKRVSDCKKNNARHHRTARETTATYNGHKKHQSKMARGSLKEEGLQVKKVFTQHAVMQRRRSHVLPIVMRSGGNENANRVENPKEWGIKREEGGIGGNCERQPTDASKGRFFETEKGSRDEAKLKLKCL